MADINRLMDQAMASLVGGDNDAALKLLAEIERKGSRKPELLDEGFRASLERFADLARAAAEGIADARALVVLAGENLRNAKTYDGKGAARPAAFPKRPLGRF